MQKTIGYVTEKEKRLIIPNLLMIARSTFTLPEDGSTNHRGTIKAKAMNLLNRELEGHFDTALGMFVFNRTELPSNECQRYRSIADLSEASLFRSKLGEFSILQYDRENQTVAVTLHHQVNTCRKTIFFLPGLR